MGFFIQFWDAISTKAPTDTEHMTVDAAKADDVEMNQNDKINCSVPECEMTKPDDDYLFAETSFQYKDGSKVYNCFMFSLILWVYACFNAFIYFF
jgi:hypothetical protein